jgi:multidrug efflux system membrane fusion protein
MRKRLVAVIGAVLAVGIAGGISFVLVAYPGRQPTSPTVAPAKAAAVRPARVQEITLRSQTQRLTLAGTVVPRYETTVGFRVPGKIVERLVEVGGRVTAGQPIARLDPADLRLALDNARAALAAAEAEAVRARADLERYVGLKGTSAFVPQVLDQRQSLANGAQARLEQAKSQLDTAANNLAYATLNADSDGVVTALMIEVGQVVSAGQQVAKIARLDELEIRVDVPEQRLAMLNGAERVTYELWSEAGVLRGATLRELAPMADTMTRTYAARFSITERPALIAMGMTATLALERGTQEQVAEVPMTAIFQRGTGPAVWIVDRRSGALSLRAVTVARWRDDSALISAGLANGELIVTVGVHKLEVGQRVKPQTRATSDAAVAQSATQ